MKTQKHYFSLRIKGGNAYHSNGERKKLIEPVVNIGETADCDIRFDAGVMVPEYYATIIRNDDGKSWRIVRRSQHVDVQILGKGSIGYVSQLNDGDLIRFEQQADGTRSEGMTLCFHGHFDDRYDEEGREDVWKWAVAGLIGLVAIIALALNVNRQDGIVAADVEPLEESIFLVKVDSVCRTLVINGNERQVPPMKTLQHETHTGTAFLTTEGMLVTARHCVEYWIGEQLDLTTKVSELDEDDIVRWAIETESFNQTHLGDSLMRLKVFFSLYDFMGSKKYVFCSTDSHVHINTEHDGVFMLADFTQDYYWRSVRPYFTDRQMELGDILWIDGVGEKGKVQLADKTELEHVKSGTRLMVCGFPMTGIGDKRMTFTEGTIRRKAAATAENLFFESNINHGFSGGPVLMKVSHDVVAIGVVSRVDSISSGLYKWAVPVSEVRREKGEVKREKG